VINETVSVEQAIKLLNEMLVIDPDATQNLLDNRVKCNETLANHPTIQVRQYENDKYPQVGFVGVLNGLFGIDDVSGIGAICCEVDNNGKILNFARTKSASEPTGEMA